MGWTSTALSAATAVALLATPVTWASIGDMNCDEWIDSFDIDPFVVALMGQDPYEAAYPECRWLNGDINCDNMVNAFDIDPFVSCLVDCPAPGCEGEVKTYEVPTNRTGCQEVPAGEGRWNVFESFDMHAVFEGDGKDCQCCEYRQEVRGKFVLDGITLVHMLCGTQLDEFAWQEDGVMAGAQCQRYGHRCTPPASAAEEWTVNRRVGCDYLGHDTPGVYNMATGTPYHIELDFRGKIIDVCIDDEVLESSLWYVVCIDEAGRAPRPAPRRQTSLETVIHGTPISIRLAIYETPELVATVAIPNGTGAVPLAAADVDLKIKGLDVMEAPRGILPETRLMGATAHAIYRFAYPAEKRGPLEVELSVHGSSPRTFAVNGE